jgi:hypothetical protein
MAYTETIIQNFPGSVIEKQYIEATTLTTSEQFSAPIALGEFDQVRVDIQTVQASSSTDTSTHRLVESPDGTSARGVTVVAMAVGANQTVQVGTITTTGSAGTYNSVLTVDYTKNGYKKPKFILLGSLTSASSGTKIVTANVTLYKARK